MANREQDDAGGRGGRGLAERPKRLSRGGRPAHHTHTHVHTHKNEPPCALRAVTGRRRNQILSFPVAASWLAFT